MEALKERETGRWSDEEHERFMLGIMQFGKDWKRVEQMVGTRTGSQVRSHAQKFFNKIQKQQKQRKPKDHLELTENLRSPADQFSETENDPLKNGDEATPMELLTLIRKESQHKDRDGSKTGKVNLSSLKKSLADQQKIEEEQNQLPQFKRFNSFRSMNNILSAYENVNDDVKPKEQEDQGFLILLTKKYKKYFSKDGDFESLIDFGNPHEVANAYKAEKSIRKRSFTLPEGAFGNEETLQEIKKKIKTEIVDDKFNRKDNPSHISTPQPEKVQGEGAISCEVAAIQSINHPGEKPKSEKADKPKPWQDKNA